MTQPGLAHVAPELVDVLRGSTEDARRQIVADVCLLAVQRAGVTDPEITEALEAIRLRRLGGSGLRTRIETLARELDKTAWEVQDRVEAGDATDVEYRRDFAKARAVAAVAFALDGSLSASFDALYEAYYAIDNRPEFLRAVTG